MLRINRKIVGAMAGLYQNLGRLRLADAAAVAQIRNSEATDDPLFHNNNELFPVNQTAFRVMRRLALQANSAAVASSFTPEPLPELLAIFPGYAEQLAHNAATPIAGKTILHEVHNGNAGRALLGNDRTEGWVPDFLRATGHPSYNAAPTPATNFVAPTLTDAERKRQIAQLMRAMEPGRDRANRRRAPQRSMTEIMRTMALQALRSDFLQNRSALAEGAIATLPTLSTASPAFPEKAPGPVCTGWAEGARVLGTR